MTADVEQEVRESLSSLLALSFENTKPDLGTREKVDGWAKLSENHWLILEVEDGQKHPTTNVLKLWRFLDVRPEISIILIHVYFNDSKAIKSSRGTLAAWLGEKMETILHGRFYYRRLIFDRKFSKWTGEAELKEAILNFQS